MQRWKNSLFNTVLFLNCLLLFLAIAGDKIHVPAWLQVAGRLHPLLLHFPIVLLLLYIAWSILLQAKFNGMPAGPEDEMGRWLLLFSALTASLTAVFGILLSRETGYNPEALWWHKWAGVAVSLFSFGWYVYKNNIHRHKYMPQLAAIISFVLIVFTGHQGSNITHGENYLLAPVTPEKTRPVVPIEQAVVYTDMVKPILETKCISCHNSKKAKGDLVMETESLLLKGGRHGTLWTAGQANLSLLMQRIHLPEAEKKHMPPAGKPQLDEDEIAILFNWIKSGASFKQKVLDLPATDSLHLLANNIFIGSQEVPYDFSAASDKTIEKLNNTNRLVHPIALVSPALAVNFYNRQNYTHAALQDLLAIKIQLVSLDMAYMPVKEEDFATIAEFQNLRKLNLNFSTVTGTSLLQLKKLPMLTNLSLSGANLTLKDLQPLASFPKLRTVYVWEVPLNEKDREVLKKLSADVHFETGVTNDSVRLKLNPPIQETEERIINGAPIAIKLKHYIKGAIIKYTLDGSNPDSIYSTVYDTNLVVSNACVFKARAFKPGWLGSDSIATTFYKNSFRADSIRTITPLDSFYKGNAGAKTLIDGQKGDFNVRTGKWLGFRRNKMEMLLHYGSPVTVSSVTLSCIVNIGGFILPPASIEIWGGANEKSLARLARLNPQQPDSVRASSMRTYDCKFAAAKVSFIKVVATPVSKLPAWHPSKGQKPWLFTDEIFVN